ncbi:RNA-binding protein with serine-rich domain 1 [Aspergillus foveolatus]|uniref:RNA-binding protein with serine-rich domain 1 n=1 Tax=Aspergillus foveolatus TaxID=210207 RepID=UPI003CCDBDE3
MYRDLSRHRRPRRSVSPRSRSSSRTTSRSPVSEGSVGGRNGQRSASRSRSRTRIRGRSYSRSQSPPSQRSSKIVVEKLTKNVTEPHLLEIFGSFGEIQSIDLPVNHAFMTNRGTAYIIYHDPADAEAAIAHMHEAQLDGAVLNVSIVLPKRAFSRSPPPMANGRGKYGRQRHLPGRPADDSSRRSPYQQRASPPRRYGRSRAMGMERHDLYRPRSLSRSWSRSLSRSRSRSLSRSRSRSFSRSRSRSPRRSRSFSSRSPSTTPPRRRARYSGLSRR